MPDLPRRAAAVVLLIAAAGARAASPQPAGTVAELQAGLAQVMKAGKSAKVADSYAKLLPLVRATHDLPAMTRLVAGPAWTGASAADQAKLVEAFTRHSTIAYATNFATAEGRFVVDPKVEMRGGDALVRSTIGGTALNYRLRQGEGGWRIVDAFADGVSQLATQRAEFAATVSTGGLAGLAAKLTAADDAKLRK